MPPLAAIGIIVSDLDRAIAFYRLLGLDFPQAASADDHVEAPGPGGLRVMLDTEAGMASFSNWTAPVGGHRVALAFQCPSPEEVDRLFGELLDAGGRSHLEPFDAPWGQRYATVYDHDGNAVDLFAPLG